MLGQENRTKVRYIGLVLVAVVALYTWYRWTKSDPPLGDADLADEMVLRATEAVKMAKSEYGKVLDFSPASVESVEEILAKIHERHALDPLSDEALVKHQLRWGGYVGEVIRRMRPCHWSLNSKHGGEGSFPIVFEDGTGETFPARWCIKRIVNGPVDNVWDKFNAFAQGRNVPSDTLPAADDMK